MPSYSYYTKKYKEAYYCKDCNKLYYDCYEYDSYIMCKICWNDLKIIPEHKIKPFIRKKRLEKLNDIS
jgi:hypothetical protein